MSVILVYRARSSKLDLHRWVVLMISETKNRTVNHFQVAEWTPKIVIKLGNCRILE